MHFVERVVFDKLDAIAKEEFINFIALLVFESTRPNLVGCCTPHVESTLRTVLYVVSV
jgi:hypothetical protein